LSIARFRPSPFVPDTDALRGIDVDTATAKLNEAG
jgi:hypothetical protein